MATDDDRDETPPEPPPPPDGAAPGARLRVVHPDDAYPSWEEIYRDNVDRIYRLMFAKVGNRADAEDLTAEVFMTALRPLRVSASVGEVRAYLLAVARTALAAHWRRTLGQPVTTLDAETVEWVFADPGPAGGGAGPGSGSGAPTSAAPEQAEAILAELPPRYQRILRLRFLEARTIREAAAELGVSVANAKVLQHRALRRAAEVSAR